MVRFIILFIILLSSGFAFSWSYPLRQITKPSALCKYRLWKDTPVTCRISLPKLVPSTYKKYINDIMFYRRIYTVLWLSSYKGGWDIKNGTHLGVDIATNVGTPVYAIGPGKVVIAGYKRGWGKVVVIKHKVNGTYIYSAYAHLSKTNVKVGQNVNENTKIGEVGNTGNSWGAHLHFQIDRANSWTHPFWFRYCKGKSIKSIVNNTSCIQEAYKYTLDPLAFLESNGAIVKKPVYEVVNKTPTIERKKIITLEQIKQQEIKEFVNSVKLRLKLAHGGVYKIGKQDYFILYLADRRGRNYKRIFPDSLEIVYDKNYLSNVVPSGLRTIVGSRKIYFIPKKEGVTWIQVKMGDIVLANKSIRIIKPGKFYDIKDGIIKSIPLRKYLSSPVWGINIFKDKNYLPLIRTPFKGKYILTSKDDIYFCKAPNNIKKLNYFKCDWYNAYKQLSFSYKDTILGLFLFKFYSIKSKKTKLIVKNVDGKEIFAMPVYFNDVKYTNPKSNYTKILRKACYKGLCLNLLTRGYIWNDKEISLYHAKYLIQNFNYLLGKKLRSGVKYSDKYRKITRKEFILALFSYLGEVPKIKYKTKYIDLGDNDKFRNIVRYLTKLGFKWKDRFSEYHFQPNKNITYEEALYLANFLIDKFKK